MSQYVNDQQNRHTRLPNQPNENQYHLLSDNNIVNNNFNPKKFIKFIPGDNEND